MANGKKPVLTGVIQNPETKKILGRVALWNYEGKKEEEDFHFQKLGEKNVRA